MKHKKMNPTNTLNAAPYSHFFFLSMGFTRSKATCLYGEKIGSHEEEKKSLEIKIEGFSEIFRLASCMLKLSQKCVLFVPVSFLFFLIELAF